MKRFELGSSVCYDHAQPFEVPDMVEAPADGEWVRYEDAQALLNERDAEIDNFKAYSAEQTRKIEVLTETHVLYTWLRRKADQHPNDVVAVYMNIGHDWVPVQDLERDLRTMIEAEQP